MDYQEVRKIIAAAARGPDDLTKLLKDGVDINTVEEKCPFFGEETSDSALTLVTRLGKSKIIEILLDHGARVDAKTKFGKTALHIACEKGREDVVKLLLDIGGADIGAKFNHGTTALLVAAEKGHEGIVKLLLDRGADVDAETHRGTTALHLASEKGHASIVKLLVERGATVITKDKSDNIALRNALQGGHQDVVQLLINLGSNIKTLCHPSTIDYFIERAIQQNNKTIVELLLKQEIGVSDIDFHSHLHGACKNGNEEIVKLLLQNDNNCYLTDLEERKTVLHSAVEGGNINVVKMLLDLKINVNAIGKKDFSEETAIWEAVNRADSSVELFCETWERENDPKNYSDDEKIIELLLEHGANINDKCHRGSLLQCVCELGYTNAVKKLLQFGASFDGTNSWGETLLHAAVKGCIEDIDILKLFLDSKQFNVNGENRSGESALHSAVQLGNKQIVQLLLNHGANINTRSSDRRTALYCAIEKNHNAIAQLLSQHGANLHDVWEFKGKCENALHISAKFGNETLVKLFLNLGMDVNSVSHSNETALDYALWGGDVGTFKVLLDNGANIEGREGYYLMEACRLKHQGIAQLLLERGADSNARDEDGNHVLLASIKSDNHEALQLLLDYGADIEAKGQEGFNALLTAVYDEGEEDSCGNVYYKHCETIVEQLLDQGINVNSKSSSKYDIGTSALKFALNSENVKNIRLLLNYHADINLENKNEVFVIKFSFDIMDINLIITQHVVKMMSENLFVSQLNLKSINDNEILSNWKTDCEREIEALKCKTIEDTAINFYSLLVSRSLRQLGTYARNKNVIEFFKAGEHRIMFPMYGYSLRYQLKRGVWRNYLEDKLKYFFCAVANAEKNEGLPILLDVCITKIFSYLTNRDLRRLIRVSNIRLEYEIHNMPL